MRTESILCFSGHSPPFSSANTRLVGYFKEFISQYTRIHEAGILFIYFIYIFFVFCLLSNIPHLQIVL